MSHGTNAVEEERQVMKKYWDSHSTAGSIEEMMLDDDAAKIEAAVRCCQMRTNPCTCAHTNAPVRDT